MFGCEVSDSDIQALSLLKTTSLVTSGDRSLKLLPNALGNDTETSSGSMESSMSPFGLGIYDLTGKGCLRCFEVLGQRQLSHLTELNLSMAQMENCCLADLKPRVIPQLKILRLKRCITRLDDLKHLPVIVHGWDLRILDISHSSGISRKLSILMEQPFQLLHTLVFSDCGLKSKDLGSLARAKVEDILPNLMHLDISQNINDFGSLFSFECEWERLISLNIRNDAGLVDYLNVLQHHVELGSLFSLKTLRFYADAATKFRPGKKMKSDWANLTTLQIVSTLKDIEYALNYARDTIKIKSCFPKLRTVCVVVKLNSDLAKGNDCVDMSCAMDLLPTFRHQAQNVPIREPDDKKFVEALYELESLGIEVHVWFSGDEQFTRKAGVM